MLFITLPGRDHIFFGFDWGHERPIENPKQSVRFCTDIRKKTDVKSISSQ